MDQVAVSHGSLLCRTHWFRNRFYLYIDSYQIPEVLPMFDMLGLTILSIVFTIILPTSGQCVFVNNVLCYLV